MAPVGAAPVNSLFADPNGKVWQYVAQISRGEKIAGVEGLRNLATSEAGRKALLANPAVLEPLVNQIQLAGAKRLERWYSTNLFVLLFDPPPLAHAPAPLNRCPARRRWRGSFVGRRYAAQSRRSARRWPASRGAELTGSRAVAPAPRWQWE